MCKLEARELRVGNYVYFGDDFPQIVELEAVDGRYENIDSRVTSTLGLQYVSPIPLTEEWLKKAGCEKHSENWHRLKISDRGFLNFYTDGDTIRVEMGNKSGYSFGFIKIEYLHQLQNTYYALKGEELIIKI